MQVSAEYAEQILATHLVLLFDARVRQALVEHLEADHIASKVVNIVVLIGIVGVQVGIRHQNVAHICRRERIRVERIGRDYLTRAALERTLGQAILANKRSRHECCVFVANAFALRRRQACARVVNVDEVLLDCERVAAALFDE